VGWKRAPIYHIVTHFNNRDLHPACASRNETCRAIVRESASSILKSWKRRARRSRHVPRSKKLQECRWLRYKNIFDRIPPAKERKAALESEIQAMSWNESVRPLNIKP
jgi:hypothetical protein